MSTPTAVEKPTVVIWMDLVAGAIREQADHLTQLDAAIGDGDHGINMKRGFDAVTETLAAQEPGLPPGRLLVLTGKTLVSTVGGASGPLWGSFFRGTGRALGDAAALDARLAEALAAGVRAVRDLGAAAPGDKTMVDALVPAVDTLRDALAGGASLGAAVARAAAAAQEGARATVPLQARKGRASYLGERSVGHEDPGAASTVIVVTALARAVG